MRIPGRDLREYASALYKYGTSPKYMLADIHMHRSMYTCIYFYMHTYIYRCTPVYIISLYYLYKYRYLHTKIYTDLYYHIWTCLQICTYFYIHTYIHIHICNICIPLCAPLTEYMDIYIGVSTHIRHVFAYNHIYTCAHFLSRPC